MASGERIYSDNTVPSIEDRSLSIILVKTCANTGGLDRGKKTVTWLHTYDNGVWLTISVAADLR